MLNRPAVFFAILLSLTSWLAKAAGSAPPATCFDLPHGENGQGSTNELYLPHLRTNGTWYATVHVTNTSDEHLNVTMKFNQFNGLAYLPQSYTLQGEFDSNNSPFALSTGGAILKPGRTARVIIFDDSNSEALVGRLNWQADACIENAMLVSVRSYLGNTTAIGTSLMFLNNGQPF